MSRFLPIALGAVLLCAPAAWGVTIDTVPVLNAGNLGEQSGSPVGVGPGAIVGAVPYNYQMGRTEVTNAQYAEFLNAKAAGIDLLGLYDPTMGGGTGGITRNGLLGSYTYTARAGWENLPVNYVNFYSALRFVNWLGNGQGNGDTENGAYTLVGGFPMPSNGSSIARNADATWVLPSEDEWYKAAYYDPSSGSYFDFPTGTNDTPISQAPPGDGNSINYHLVSLTEVGAYAASASPYGTFDQGGNVQEWTETKSPASARIVRGGTSNNSLGIYAANRLIQSPTFPMYDTGFRVAFVPEPSAGLLGVLGACSLVLWRRATACRRANRRRR